MEIKGTNSVEVWKKVLAYIMENGTDFRDSNNRICRECMNIVLTVENTKDITKPIEILNSFEKSIYPPLEEIRNFILGKKELPGYYYNYGERLFNPEWRNQIDEYIVPLLKKNSSTRRAVIILHDPKRDSYIDKKEIPGIVAIDFSIRKNKLQITAIIRSNDMFYGWPGNICQINMLQEYVSKQTNIPAGKISTISISAHLFEEQSEDIRKIMGMKN
jgi:thymidylate synthase